MEICFFSRQEKQQECARFCQTSLLSSWDVTCEACSSVTGSRPGRRFSLSVAFQRGHTSEELHTATVASERRTARSDSKFYSFHFLFADLVHSALSHCDHSKEIHQLFCFFSIASTKTISRHVMHIYCTLLFTHTHTHFKLLRISSWNKREKKGSYPLFFTKWFKGCLFCCCRTEAGRVKSVCVRGREILGQILISC